MVCVEAAYIERTHCLIRFFCSICIVTANAQSYRNISFDDSNGMPELASFDMYDLEDFSTNNKLYASA